MMAGHVTSPEQFAEHWAQNSSWAEKMHNPERACGSCGVVSDIYAEHLKSQGQRARVAAYDVQGDPHMVVEHRGSVVDWTHRQYDPEAPVPLIMKQDAYMTHVEKYG